MSMELTSAAFSEGEAIPREHSCEGENVNPPLSIEGTPEEAVSLAVIMDDPDAPSGDFTHWLVWNLPADIADISSGELPEDAVEGYNDFEKGEYFGPCPPSGTHRYHFRVYALDTEIELDEDASRDKLEQAMAGHILDEASLTGTYSK